MDPASILRKVISEALVDSRLTASTKVKRELKSKEGETVKSIPFNQCPECKVCNAFCLMLPPIVHEKNPKTGIVEEKTYGKGHWECKYCHFEKTTL